MVERMVGNKVICMLYVVINTYNIYPQSIRTANSANPDQIIMVTPSLPFIPPHMVVKWTLFKF